LQQLVRLRKQREADALDANSGRSKNSSHRQTREHHEGCDGDEKTRQEQQTANQPQGISFALRLGGK
jgi:hypothetical protein